MKEEMEENQNDYAETYEEYKTGKFEYVKGLGRASCYGGLDYFQKLLEKDKYYSEAFEDNYVFIESWINHLEKENKSLQSQLKAKEEVIKEAREKLKSYITFCENDSQGAYEVCNMAIRNCKNIDEILSKGENK